VIPKEIIDEIFATARIEEVVGEFVQLKKSGSNFKGLSPFTEERTPSFYVSPAKGIYKCFSSGNGGNLVSFLMEHEKWSYPEALRYVARKYNIEIKEEEETPEVQEQRNEKESLLIINRYATTFFQEQLLETQEGKTIGLSYLKERGFLENTIEKFQLGYLSDKWSVFTDAALEKGYKKEYLEQLGLTKTSNDKSYDFFRGRVMFPIHNLTGQVVGYGGRTLKNDKSVAKYFNSPESIVYHKSKVLYGIYQAKKSIVSNNNCYLVEGYTDVVSMVQSGIENVVASSGTALTKDQIRLIKRYTENITILFDSDAAGIRASFRGIDLILEEGMNVKVVLFPDGEDPDSFSRKHNHTDLLAYLEKQAKDFIVFKTDLLYADSKNDPIKKSKLIHEIVESIALIPDGIARSVYINECSSLIDVPEQVLLNELNKLRANKQTQNRQTQAKQETTPTSLDPDYAYPLPEQNKNVSISYQETDIIRLLLNFGDHEITIAVETDDGSDEDLAVSVAEYILHEIADDEITFSNELYEQIIAEYIQQLESVKQVPNNRFFVQHSNQEIAQTTVDLISFRYFLSDNWEKKHHIYTTMEEDKLAFSAKRAVYSLKLTKVRSMIHLIQQEIKACENDYDKASEFLKQQQKLEQVKIVLSKELERIIVA
jgi:DNA primase